MILRLIKLEWRYDHIFKIQTGKQITYMFFLVSPIFVYIHLFALSTHIGDLSMYYCVV